ncbi:15793_t:CDS:2 [Cetraspora pellucida]|uniref:15793_t:CDS:1 n=1 Tax=Cetraspora pellucida TaxID=1433469 RepID=A0ACA9M028_9GLOM|nr:15793_t:CDS:2 [Cetraspora pellucida]
MPDVIKDLNSEVAESISSMMVAPIDIPECTNVDDFDNSDDDAYFYMEENWHLFEQVVKRICTKKMANNWHHIQAMMKWS